MVERLLNPELLDDLQRRFDMDIWDDLPAVRLRFRIKAEKALKNISLLDHIPFEDYMVPGMDQDPDVRVRVYNPENITGPLPAMLWIHGGGFVLGTINEEVQIMQDMADKVGCIIVAVEYRLAPEHPFPAAQNDCYAALKWLFKNVDALRIDPTNVAIGGVSAGAGLAAGLALMIRDRDEFKLVFQLLLCPMLDDRNEQPSTHLPLKGVSWDRENNSKAWDAYLRGMDSREISGYAVPARANDLSRLPPAYIAVGSLDLFLDENILYGRRLMGAQVSTELHVFPGCTHAFEFKVPGAMISKRARFLHYDIIKHAFGKTVSVE